MRREPLLVLRVFDAVLLDRLLDGYRRVRRFHDPDPLGWRLFQANDAPLRQVLFTLTNAGNIGVDKPGS
jgi:hypothetical protein